MPISSRSVRTRYGTRRSYAARCPVPGCPYKGPGHYKAGLAQADLDVHIAKAHPRPRA